MCLKTFDSLKRATFHSQRLVNAHDSCWYRQYSEQTKKVTTKKLGMFRQKPSVLLGLVVGPVWSNGMSHCTSGWFDVSREKREGYYTLPTCNCIPQERRKNKAKATKGIAFLRWYFLLPNERHEGPTLRTLWAIRLFLY